MATLVSPGVSVTVINESFFIPVLASTVPLFFVATKSGKTQANGVTPAAGTLETGVVRTVTSLSQSLQLYGVPDFRRDIVGNEFHGDARNEYGLLALNQYLSVGNRAFVVRANVDLTDTPIEFMSLGTPVYNSASLEVNAVGNGSLSLVTASSSMVQPQLITLRFTSPTSFSVTGSVAGLVGVGVVGASFVSTVVNFTVAAGSVLFAAGDEMKFSLVYAGVPGGSNVGNGNLTNLVPDQLALEQTVTITFTSAGNFWVNGTVTGGSALSGPFGTVGAPFSGAGVEFTAIAGTVPFAAGDTFTITLAEVTITSPLGANDAARRVAIVTALQAEINSNVDVRSELYEYNLILCPGYHETVDEMVALSTAVKEEALVLADTPANKTPDQVASWALTSARISNEKAAYYYPWCVTSNIDGRNVLGAPSGTAVRTIAYSDNQGYVWSAPAGTSRGVVEGVTSVGYFTGTPGTATVFIETNLNEGQRDNLYEYYKNINPIVFFPGRGILVWGQKTSAPAASALDRINVVRLVMYLRRGLRKGALPFVFEPNDQLTRDNLKAAADGFMNDILAKRGLTDFASYCDATNNTPDRIDRNELYLDIAIKPTRAAEFIYIPIRVVATGADI